MADNTYEEHHRQISGGWFRAGIFGVSDGLVTNVSLILGFAGANPGHNVVRLAGLAGLVAGGFSMGSGEYLSMRAQKELLEYEIDVERIAHRDNPAGEQRELRQIFIDRGIEPDLAERLSVDLMRDPDLALRTHTREELGIDPSATGSPWGAAISSFLAFVVGAFIPLLPWLWSSSGNPLGWSIGFGALCAAGVGAGIGWYTHHGMWRCALRQVVIATLAAGVTFGLGHLVGSR
jgi:VIT1/CCC1 family predicted Fe2+/Mn2+ transporter